MYRVKIIPDRGRRSKYRQDLTNDGKPDIVIANFNGVFLFENIIGTNLKK
jgi:hypothetical protein